MLYDKPDPQGLIFCGYSFNMMNTLYEFAAKISQCWEKLAVCFN